MNNIKFCMLIGLLFFISCSDNDILLEQMNEEVEKSEVIESISQVQKEKYLEKFANILSKAVYSKKELRSFLKEEALKQFDKNYDVLYFAVKNKKVGDVSFRDLLISYSSLKELEEIEMNVPLLNVYVPKIPFFNVTPENLDVDDEELPVVINKTKETPLYFNGKKEINIPKGEVPSFHTLVVNENSRVVVPSEIGTKSTGENSQSFTFKSPNYDGSINNTVVNAKTRSSGIWIDEYYYNLVRAYDHFHANDNSIRQKAFQRDYIYYGITPEKPEGNLNRAVSEYLCYLVVNPMAYFRISDDYDEGRNTDDPYINNGSTTSRHNLSTEELVNKFWSKGSYNFKFEIYGSNSDRPQVVYIPLRPEQLWNFNYKVDYGHRTLFRRKKYTYWIDPSKFTSYRIDLHYLDLAVTLPKWDISQEGLSRYVIVSEEDISKEITHTETNKFSMAYRTNFKGNMKVNIGLKDIGTGEVGGSVEEENTYTTEVSRTSTIIRNEKSDPLGKVKIYFYDPIVEDIHNMTKIHMYNTGFVKFGMLVM